MLGCHQTPPKPIYSVLLGNAGSSVPRDLKVIESLVTLYLKSRFIIPEVQSYTVELDDHSSSFKYVTLSCLYFKVNLLTHSEKSVIFGLGDFIRDKLNLKFNADSLEAYSRGRDSFGCVKLLTARDSLKSRADCCQTHYEDGDIVRNDDRDIFLYVKILFLPYKAHSIYEATFSWNYGYWLTM